MKTIEQAAKESSEKAGYNPKIASDIVGKTVYECAFKAGVIFYQRWIPVEEELPEICDFYLTKQSDNIKPHVYYYDGDYKGFFQGRGVQIFTITHWRPIEIK